MQRVAILYDASQAVLSTFDLDEVLNQILAIARDYFRLQSGAILLLDRNTQELHVRAQFGEEGHQSHAKIRVGEGITGTAIKIKRPLYVPDVLLDSRYIAGMPHTRSELAIPLMVRDEVVGVLDCQSSELDHFDAETVDLLTLFSTQASIGLQNAQLYSLEQRRAAQLEAINAIAKQASAVLELGVLLKKVCSLLLQSFPLDHVVIFLRDEEGRLVLRAHDGTLTPRLAEDDVLATEPGCAAHAIDTGSTVIVNDTTSSSYSSQCLSETKSEVSLPLASSGEKLGLLMCHSSRAEAFQHADVQALESVADIVATAIHNAAQVEKVRQLAYRDGLTGMFNRRHFEVRILEEMDRASRYAGGLSVLMIDIDNFKLVNDEFGHLLGDEVLREVSNIFAQQLRKVDAACRFGGEEFAVIVPATTGENALAVAEKLRRAVEGWHFPGVPRRISISIGVAEYPQHGETRDALVRAADAALYVAKQKGRNRVQSATIAEVSGANG
ncbi:MAG TPA: sensor domain-containing diguanylate cyclase [Clostridia bacterium]|nr:sensor domain-containing diguanylate cyclase [Clostridia bacterium]